ncbi:MAG: hypothetical protein PUE04_05205 [Lachnospira sp.]|nr:hypothetical protein [Lachnospira sp.]
MAYWIGEFIRTMLVYGLVMFLWPSVVFRSHLAKHSRTYRFAFCALLMVLLPDMAVLCLGLIPHALNAWVVRILFYGAFLYRLAPLTAQLRTSGLRELGKLSRGTIGIKSFCRLAARLPGRAARSIGRGIRSFTKGHVLTCAILAALCCYSVLYFSWGAFDTRAFSLSDVYVHQAWITGLTEGKIFSGGIYPEGMHTFIYLMHAVSGISVYNLLLFTGGIYTAVLMVSIWLFLREIFHWEGTPLLIVTAFLTIDQENPSDIFLMARLQGALPQEFAMYAAFLGGAFLLRYLKKQKGARKESGLAKAEAADSDGGFFQRTQRRISGILYDEDPDLRIFAWGVAVTFAVHFYVTIMLAFICLAIAVPMIRQMLSRKGLPAVLKAAVLAVLIAMAPMAGAFAEGHPLQGSLNWAVNVMHGNDTDRKAAYSGQAEISQNAEDNTGMTSSAATGAEQAYPGTEPAADENGESMLEGATERIHVQMQRAVQALQRFARAMRTAAKTYYEKGFLELYPGRIGMIYCAAMCLALILPLLARLSLSLIPPWRRFRPLADLYMMPALAALFFLTDFLASAFGLVQLIAAARVLSMARIFLLASGGMLPDMAACGLMRVLRVGRTGKSGKADGFLTLAGIFGSLSLVIGSGHYHGYLYQMACRYPEAVEMTREIVRDMPKESYTVVSPTEDLYQLLQSGYHEELLTFVKMEESYPGYTIPTRYVYIFIEKEPLLYANCYFTEGPQWLAARGKYYRIFTDVGIECGDSPDFAAASVSEEDADKTLDYAIGSSAAAMDPEGRVILEAKAARWVRNFQEAYPDACRVWYEDDRFVCYRITQDPQIPYKLGFTAQQVRAQQEEGNS